MAEERVQSPWTEALRGRTLAGRYRLGEPIGAGGVGAVFGATHLGTGREVAIKVLLPALVGDDLAVRRFAREARAAAQLGRRGAVEIIDFASDEACGPFLVMELLSGEPLSRRLERGGGLPVDEALGVALDVVDTLEEAHEKGIVHRDLKPANIFLARDAEGRRVVKLLDFGVSRIAASEQATKITRTGVLLGTVRYMPPEQAERPSEVDQRADVYSVGAVLYHALAGQPPYAGLPGAMVLLSLLREAPRPLGELAPALPEAVLRLVGRAMARDRDARFADASSLRQALVEALVADDDDLGAPGLSLPMTVPAASVAPSSTIAEESPSFPDLREALQAKRPATRPQERPPSATILASRASSARSSAATPPGRSPFSLGLLVAGGLVALLILMIGLGLGGAWLASCLTAGPTAGAAGPQGRDHDAEALARSFEVQLEQARAELRGGQRGAARARLSSARSRWQALSPARAASVATPICRVQLLLGEIATGDVGVGLEGLQLLDFHGRVSIQYQTAQAYLSEGTGPCSQELEACFFLACARLQERVGEVILARERQTPVIGATEAAIFSEGRSLRSIALSHYRRAELARPRVEPCSSQATEEAARLSRPQSGAP